MPPSALRSAPSPDAPPGHPTAPHSNGIAPRATASAQTGPDEPDWAQDAIFYQVFPDRFYNGDMGNDPADTQPWGSAPTNDAFQGGDLVGIQQKIPYLKNLGVTALYLNPIFTSPSNHKYNITDYEHVDPHLGGDQALHGLVDSLHANGMKIILDGVFNHTSHQHPWFEDVREKGPQSQYFDYYTVEHWPIRYQYDDKGVLRSSDYQSWWGYATLPELRTDNPAVRNYFLDGKDAIVKRWIRDYHIDGWRMDVADEIEHDFWKDARTQIKATDPNAFLVAENWHDASDYLHGDEFDSAMNYQYFQEPAVDYFAKKTISSDDFVARLRNPYPASAQHAMFNILDSHDTERFITSAGGDWYRLRPAAIFQMTYPGVPVIYYGDEVGMQGGLDPDDRRAFPWELVNPSPQKPAVGGEPLPPASNHPQESSSQQLLELYRNLIAVRKAEPSLRRGDFEVLATHNANKTVAYRRSDGSQRDALVALNDDVTDHDVVIPAAPFAADGTRYTDALSGATYAVKQGQIVVPKLDGNYGAVLLRDV